VRRLQLAPDRRTLPQLMIASRRAPQRRPADYGDPLPSDHVHHRLTQIVRYGASRPARALFACGLYFLAPAAVTPACSHGPPSTGANSLGAALNCVTPTRSPMGLPRTYGLQGLSKAEFAIT
jgi:hypothetical protein